MQYNIYAIEAQPDSSYSTRALQDMRCFMEIIRTRKRDWNDKIFARTSSSPFLKTFTFQVRFAKL